jgi:hypothetical protein
MARFVSTSLTCSNAATACSRVTVGNRRGTQKAAGLPRGSRAVSPAAHECRRRQGCRHDFRVAVNSRLGVLDWEFLLGSDRQCNAGPKFRLPSLWEAHRAECARAVKGRRFVSLALESLLTAFLQRPRIKIFEAPASHRSLCRYISLRSSAVPFSETSITYFRRCSGISSVANSNETIKTPMGRGRCGVGSQ